MPRNKKPPSVSHRAVIIAFDLQRRYTGPVTPVVVVARVLVSIAMEEIYGTDSRGSKHSFSAARIITVQPGWPTNADIISKVRPTKDRHAPRQ
jgi:hypothetical protein